MCSYIEEFDIIFAATTSSNEEKPYNDDEDNVDDQEDQKILNNCESMQNRQAHEELLNEIVTRIRKVQTAIEKLADFQMATIAKMQQRSLEEIDINWFQASA